MENKEFVLVCDLEGRTVSRTGGPASPGKDVLHRQSEGKNMAIYICGDSTAASCGEDMAPMWGWGQALPALMPEEKIINASRGGRSSKSFLAEACLQPVEAELKEGDLLLIQFGHNDASDYPWRHTEPRTSYQNCLSIFIDTARTYGAVPVLLTQTPRRRFQDGKLQPTGGDYPEAVRQLARKRNVALIDVYQRGFEMLEKLGEEPSAALFMNVEKGKYPAWPDGHADDTHLRRAGAELLAAIVRDGLCELGLSGRAAAEEEDAAAPKKAALSWKNEEGGN